MLGMSIQWMEAGGTMAMGQSSSSRLAVHRDTRLARSPQVSRLARPLSLHSEYRKKKKPKPKQRRSA